jgi:hypothetical protein
MTWCGIQKLRSTYPWSLAGHGDGGGPQPLADPTDALHLAHLWVGSQRVSGAPQHREGVTGGSGGGGITFHLESLFCGHLLIWSFLCGPGGSPL